MPFRKDQITGSSRVAAPYDGTQSRVCSDLCGSLHFFESSEKRRMLIFILGITQKKLLEKPFLNKLHTFPKSASSSHITTTQLPNV